MRFKPRIFSSDVRNSKHLYFHISIYKYGYKKVDPKNFLTSDNTDIVKYGCMKQKIMVPSTFLHPVSTVYG